MQTLFKNRTIARKAKIEVLENYWFKFLCVLNQKNLEVRSIKMAEVIQQISVIPKHVR